jgi:hypothetical protein
VDDVGKAWVTARRAARDINKGFRQSDVGFAQRCPRPAKSGVIARGLGKSKLKSGKEMTKRLPAHEDDISQLIIFTK